MKEKEMRTIYAETLIELAHEDPRIMVLEADLMRAHGTQVFKDIFPQRTVGVGVAEANLVGVSAGLSVAGKIPFAATFATFASRRAFDQFFISANYARLNVKLVGTDPGVSAAFNGGTHMPFEDIGLMRMIPDLVIVEPADPTSLAEIVRLCAAHQGNTYLRLHRKALPQIYQPGERFELGKGKLLHDGDDVTLVASGGLLLNEALKAKELLAARGVSAAVIDMHTIKPLDEQLILEYAEKTGAIVTAENHQVAGGLGAAVSLFLSTRHPIPMEMVGIHDRFGQVGTQDWLMQHFKLTANEIVRKTFLALKRKR